MHIKNLFPLLLCFLLATQIIAQEQYSYMTDRIFLKQTDMVGYNFVPDFMEIPDEMDAELKVGEYSFGITTNNLFVEGKNIKGVYSVNNIDKTAYGFIFKLMNARDPTVQGHLKVIQNKYGHVEALVFKKSTKEKEIIFHLPRVPKSLRLKEKAYFTDRWEMVNQDVDSLWGKSIYPFIKIHKDEKNVQERLQRADSTCITFVEKVTIIEKKQKKKKKKKKKIKNIELGEEEEEEVMAEVEEVPEPVIEEPVAVVEEKVEEAKPTRRAPKRRKFQGYNSSNSRDLDEEEEEEEVVVEAPVTKPTPPKPTIDAGASPSPDEVAEESTEETDGEKKKVKIEKEYFINLRSILTYEDGGSENKKWSYQVKKVVEREDKNAGPDDERYQMEFTLKKGGPIYLYLTGERTISAIEIDGKKYLMRGN